MNKIWLVDNNSSMIEAWTEVFKDVPAANLEVVHDDIRHFLYNNPSIGFVVSPANSYGIMTGGYDLALRTYFDPISEKANGVPFQQWVHTAISEHGNYIPAGSCFPVYVPGLPQTFFIVPTMRRPSAITDYNIIFDCMMSTLSSWSATEELIMGNNDIVIPAFGALTGDVPPIVVAQMMRAAIDVFNKDTLLDWSWANTIEEELAAARLGVRQSGQIKL